jgi:ADP-ribose pyrophosphatase
VASDSGNDRPAESPAENWQTLARRELLNAPPWVKVAVEEVRLPNGRIVRDFYEVALPDFALIVAQTAEGPIVTLRQYKHGVRRVSTMLPAGLIEDGEDPLACAKRELLEETGYEAPRWRPLGTFVMDGNRGCGHAHLFLAQEARQVAAPIADELEPLEVRLTPPDDLVRAALSGEVAVLAHVAAFMLAVGAGFIGRPPVGAGFIERP